MRLRPPPTYRSDARWTQSVSKQADRRRAVTNKRSVASWLMIGLIRADCGVTYVICGFFWPYLSALLSLLYRPKWQKSTQRCQLSQFKEMNPMAKKRENKLHLSSTITDWPDKPFRRCSTGIFVGFFFGLEPLPTHWRDLIRTITSERRTD